MPQDLLRVLWFEEEIQLKKKNNKHRKLLLLLSRIDSMLGYTTATEDLVQCSELVVEHIGGKKNKIS